MKTLKHRGTSSGENKRSNFSLTLMFSSLSENPSEAILETLPSALATWFSGHQLFSKKALGIAEGSNSVLMGYKQNPTKQIN